MELISEEVFDILMELLGCSVMLAFLVCIWKIEPLIFCIERVM